MIAGESERVRGVGSGIINHVVAIAEEMDIRCIWGEATAYPAPFYQRTLNVEQILDHFFIEDEVMVYCRDRLRRAREQRLAT